MAAMTIRLVAVLLLVGSLLSPSAATASGTMKQLGTDPALDAPPGADLTALSVATHGSDLHIRIVLANALPVQGSYPGAGIEWAFDVGSRTYLAEGHPEPGAFRFTLFEVNSDSLRQIDSLEGSFDWATGTLDMYVPLNLINAKRGTRISGAGANGTEDVDVHQHAGPASRSLDAMATTQDFVVR
jgi:hypothetical protein